MTKLPPPLIKEMVIKSCRAFFDGQNFQEITVPVFHKALPLEANLHAFSTQWSPAQSSQTFYLPISPESTLKKALAAGVGNSYGIGHTFRNLEGSGPHHHPEFLMLEWYREDAVYEDIMTETQALVGFVKNQLESVGQPTTPLKMGEPWPKLSLIELFKTHLSADLNSLLSDEEMISFAKVKGYATDNATWSQLFDQLFLNEVEPHLPLSPFFLVDFPSRVSALCLPQTTNPNFAQRFELYIGGREIGNGNSEQTDAAKVRTYFDHEKKYREQLNLSVPPIDETFLQAFELLKHKKIAGIGLGIERLTMVLAGIDDIKALQI